MIGEYFNLKPDWSYILPPTNRRVVQPVTWPDWPITVVIQLLFKLGGRIRDLGRQTWYIWPLPASFDRITSVIWPNDQLQLTKWSGSFDVMTIFIWVNDTDHLSKWPVLFDQNDLCPPYTLKVGPCISWSRYYRAVSATLQSGAYHLIIPKKVYAF